MSGRNLAVTVTAKGWTNRDGRVDSLHITFINKDFPGLRGARACGPGEGACEAPQGDEPLHTGTLLQTPSGTPLSAAAQRSDPRHHFRATFGGRAETAARCLHACLLLSPYKFVVVDATRQLLFGACVLGSPLSGYSYLQTARLPYSSVVPCKTGISSPAQSSRRRCDGGRIRIVRRGAGHPQRHLARHCIRRGKCTEPRGG